MSVESEILRIQHNVANAYAAVSDKGGEVPLQPTSANLAASVASIPAVAAITPGDGLSQDGDTISVSTPVRGIVSFAEWDALSEDEQSKGFWIIKSDNGGWVSPKMMANNVPIPYVATASSNMTSYGSSGAFAAFDDNPNTYWANSSSDPNIWIALDFGEQKKVSGLQMQGRPNVSQLPYTFVIQGSNDGTQWTDILSESDLPVDTPGEIRNFYFPESVTYRHYRISNMLSHWKDGPKFIGIADIRFLMNINVMSIYSNGKSVNVPASSTTDQVIAVIDKKLEGVTAQEVYSTEEQRIGTWIGPDGVKKPLYRRMFFDTIPSNNAVNYICQFSSEYEPKMYQSFLERTDGFSVGTFCSPTATFNSQTWIDSNTHALGIQIGDSYIQYIGGKTCTLVLEYTKTTDTATTTLSAQSDATIKLSNSALDLSSIQAAPVTAATAGVEIAKMEEV